MVLVAALVQSGLGNVFSELGGSRHLTLGPLWDSDDEGRFLEYFLV